MRGTTAWITGLALGLMAAAAGARADDDTKAKGPGKALALRVVDRSTGEPINGVEVSSRAGAGLTKMVTDRDGRCRIDLPEKAVSFVYVTAKKPGYVPTEVEWGGQRGQKEEPPAEYTLAIEPGTTIGGIIRDEDGKPVRQASVFVLVPNNGPRDPGQPRTSLWDYEVKTDDQGRWRCDVVPAKLDDVWLRLAHPDYASDVMYGTTPKPSLERLRDRSGVMVLKKGITVTGRVHIADGDGIPGAEVAQGADRFGSHYPQTTTNDRGEFTFKGTREGELILTVKAKGFAPDLKKVVVTKGMPPVDFTLDIGHTIAGRVVDTQGKPVAGAFVAADTWRGYRSLMWRVDTDKNGRFYWDEAPADEVLCDFGKQGYMSLRHKALKSSEKAVVITMNRPLAVRGAVVDAETGKPVERFRVLPGIDWENNPTTSWERQNAVSGSGGKYEITFGEPRSGHRVRIEADGYKPAVSRAFKDDEGEVAYDVKLTKGAGVTGQVVGPDRAPAARVAVVLVVPNQGVMIQNGRTPDRRDSAIVEADEQGKFAFPAQDGKFSVVVLDDRGFALKTQDELAKSPTIALSPWARVEGKVRVGSRPGAGEPMHLNVDNGNQGNGPDAQPRPWFDYSTTADAQGRYTFERVPPGKVYVSRSIKLSERATAYSHTKHVEAKAGETAIVDIGGGGRPVVGRVVAPGGAKVDFAYAIQAFRPAMPDLGIPKDASREEQAARYKAWAESPEGKAYAERSQTNYAVKVEPDGTFRVDDVPPGTYDLNISVNEPPPGNQPGFGGELLGSVQSKVTVPRGAAEDTPIDVGTLELTMARHVKVGEVAPAFTVPTLDGKSLALGDGHLKGKYVLLDFWATWCGPCVAETPHLKAAYEAFSNDDRFAMVGLSLDQDKIAPKAYAEKNGLKWHQAFLGAESKTAIEYGVRGIPSIWLIGPDGKVVAKDLRGDGVKEAVAKALGSPTR